MHELIELLEDFKSELKDKYDGDPWVTRGLLISIAEAKKLLPKEREQIEVAWINGRETEGFGNTIWEDAEDYYTKTYSKDETQTNRL